MTDIDRKLAGEITPPAVYFGRRALLRAGAIAATAAATGLVYRHFNPLPIEPADSPTLAGITPSTQPLPPSNSGFRTEEAVTSFNDITHYNNFYEFTLDKGGVAESAQQFKTDGWTVQVDGLCEAPTTFNLDDLKKTAPAEQRIYRMRCVEAWSMVIPWDGFSLSALLQRVRPRGDAKYVAFQTLVDPKRFPNQGPGVLDWPYVEGLRMDEAMHPLTILATGIYGRPLPAQDGAPLRLVVPWKYGFKGIKSIVRITLTEKQPPCTWNLQAPNEYGFYANVNPQVDHPRWSQARERRIGGDQAKPTLMFNGYADQVASLYSGMDLRANF